MSHDELEPSVELEHLRRLLDTQPGCLLRLGADGTVLAANDAALSLLGIPSRAQGLGRDFAAWVPADQRDAWRAFTTGVLEGGRASLECDVEPAPNERRAALFHAMPLLDHPDGVSSMLISARAVGGQRQVEAAIVELEEQLRDRDAERDAARERLAEVEEERRQLRETLAGLEARLREAGGGEALHQIQSELRACEEALAASESARKAAEAEWAGARAEVRQLEMALESFANRRRQAAAASVELEEARSGRAGAEAALREAQAEIERLRAEVEERSSKERAASAERDRLLAAIRQQARQLEAMAAAAGPSRESDTAGDDAQAPRGAQGGEEDRA